MNDKKLMKYLEQHEFHLDPLGRIVIDDPDLLEAINGATGGFEGLDDSFINGACANAGCH